MKTFRILACAALLATTAASSLAHDEKAAPRTLSVTAQESISIPATHTRVTVMIESREKTPDAASAAAGAVSHKVLDFLKGSAVDRLQTGGLAVNPVFAPRKFSSGTGGEMEVTGYLAQWTASFEASVDQAGRIVARAIDLGVTRVTQFNLTATDDSIAAAQREALRLAAKRARADADAVLDALGYKATEVLKVHVNAGHVQPMGGRGMVAMAYSEKSAPALEGGVQEITGSVTLEVAY